MTHSNEAAFGLFLSIILLGFILPFIFNGFLARSRGKNVFLMLLLTLFFSWFLTLILALLPVDRKKREHYKKSKFSPIFPFACLFFLSIALIFVLDQKPDVTSTLKDRINSKASSLPSVSNIKGQKSKDLSFNNDEIQKAMEDVIAKRNVDNKNQVGSVSPRYQYEIMLFSGGKIYTDNAEIGENYVKYESRRGLIISLNRDEIKSMKRVRL